MSKDLKRRQFWRMDEAACVGCGLCAFYCVAEPGAIRIRSRAAASRE